KIADRNLRGHYVEAIRERRARLFAAAPRAGTGRAPRPARGGRRGGGFAPVSPMPTPEMKASALARAAGREDEARGREAVILLTLLNHPALAERRIEAIEDVEFICADLELLRRALISASEGLILAEERSRWLDMIERETGHPPLARLTAIPQARETGFAAGGAGEDVAEQGFEETLRRHRAVLARAREVAEAEIELGAGAGADLDRRLEAVLTRHFREAAPALPDGEDDESHLAARLAQAEESKIWIKTKRRNS
ncbi:MAG: hypothetical protein ACK5MQ_17965, partial [Pikeienuella sp.]